MILVNQFILYSLPFMVVYTSYLYFKKDLTLRIYLQVLIGAAICFINLGLLVDPVLMEPEGPLEKIDQFSRSRESAKLGLYTTFTGTLVSGASATMMKTPIRQGRVALVGNMLIGAGSLVVGLFGLSQTDSPTDGTSQ